MKPLGYQNAAGLFSDYTKTVSIILYYSTFFITIHLFICLFILNAFYYHFLFAVAEKCTCQSKWGECSLTSENSLFKLVWWPRAAYSKCLNTEWGIYEKRCCVVLHSKEALHSLEKESGNVDLCAPEYTRAYASVHTRMCTCTHRQKQQKHRHNTAHSFFPLSHIPPQLGGCYLK